MFHDSKHPISAQAALAILFASQASAGRGAISVTPLRLTYAEDDTWQALERERDFHARQRELIRMARERRDGSPEQRF
ncbi:MAG: hypothetical protein Q8R28_18405 [Dehalococcoidia bacterium]|nr:hypothetical protein [Dehalococcoidia bacterium]